MYLAGQLAFVLRDIVVVAGNKLVLVYNPWPAVIAIWTSAISKSKLKSNG